MTIRECAIVSAYTGISMCSSEDLERYRKEKVNESSIKKDFVELCENVNKKFEKEKYYLHSTGYALHICGQATNTNLYGDCTIAEDSNGDLKAIDMNTVDATSGYKEISKEEFIKIYHGGN